ncbi:hypothetical protein V5F77_12860 [Xanthobacter sp. DSM 24535]|uniref:lysozyme inhibitor LprI family protein n=1 Tax=Roseixanthobacter psychrophilus TaxID=3119917 RepID=UPI003726BA8E
MTHGIASRTTTGALMFALLAAALVVSLPSAARAASFDCAAAKAPDEQAVCATPNLNDLDVKMATQYTIVTHLVGMGQRGDLQDQQRAFLKQRAACGSNAGCIAEAYQARIGVFEEILARVYTHGPF